MSPLRKKGRGGGGSKTMAPHPSSSVSSSASFKSPDSLVPPLKLTRERRASTTQILASSKAKQQKTDTFKSFASEHAASAGHCTSVTSADQPKSCLADQGKITFDQPEVPFVDHVKISLPDQAKAPPTEPVKDSAKDTVRRASQARVSALALSKNVTSDKVRASSATRARVSSAEGSRNLVGSSRLVPAVSGEESRRSNTKPRAESRPRSSKASPSPLAPRKEISASNASSRLTSAGLMSRSKASCSNLRDSEGKLLNRESLKSAKHIVQKENMLETGRWSLPAQNNRKHEGTQTKPGRIKQPASQGRFSFGSCTSSMTTNSSKSLSEEDSQKQSNVTGAAQGKNKQDSEKESKDSTPASMQHSTIHQKDQMHVSTSLHRRLAILEGKVSQIAADLKKTKKMLVDSVNRTDSADLLSDIQKKITNIESAMSCKVSSKETVLSEDAVSMEYEVCNNSNQTSTENALGRRIAAECFATEKALHSLHVTISEHEELFRQSALQGWLTAPPRVCRLAFNPWNMEERFFLRRKLLNTRMSFSKRETRDNDMNAKLQDPMFHGHVDDLKIEDELICQTMSQMPDTEGPPFTTLARQERKDLGYLPNNRDISAHGQGEMPLSINKLSDNTGQAKQHDMEKTKESSGQQAMASAENLNNSLECNESPISNSFPENVENVAPDDRVEFYHDDDLQDQLCSFGDRVATAGWYVSDGEALLLAHDDGCCSYYDVANMEMKELYTCPSELGAPLWDDCWLIRAAGSDGRSNNYIVAATAGSALDSGFCSWDFYSKALAACHVEYNTNSPRGVSQSSPVHSPLSMSRKLSPQHNMGLPHSSATLNETGSCGSVQWWYRPCGPLMASAASSLRSVALYDVRDGDAVLSWRTNRPLVNLEYSSPVQWRDKGKLVLAENQAVSVWDVNTMDVQCMQYIELPGKHISAIYVHNSDAECSGGVRQRLSSSETEAYDGICCTQNNMNILDFRVPSGIAISFSVPGQEMQTAFARGDMILTGGLNSVSHECAIHQWSLRKAMPVCMYAFPASSSHYAHISLTQVWGSSSVVMGVNGNGLYTFKGWKDAVEGICDVEEVKNVVGTQDLYNPSFDYANSRVLLISRDRQAAWSFLPQ